jgi:hypothetical protein
MRALGEFLIIEVSFYPITKVPTTTDTTEITVLAVSFHDNIPVYYTDLVVSWSKTKGTIGFRSNILVRAADAHWHFGSPIVYMPSSTSRAHGKELLPRPASGQLMPRPSSLLISIHHRTSTPKTGSNFRTQQHAARQDCHRIF